MPVTCAKLTCNTFVTLIVFLWSHQAIRCRYSFSGLSYSRYKLSLAPYLSIPVYYQSLVSTNASSFVLSFYFRFRFFDGEYLLHGVIIFYGIMSLGSLNSLVNKNQGSFCTSKLWPGSPFLGSQYLRWYRDKCLLFLLRTSRWLLKFHLEVFVKIGAPKNFGKLTEKMPVQESF